MAKTKMQQLLDEGQSVWLDYLSRGMTRSGELRALIDKGLRGMTSNPTIFEHAIGTSTDYDDELSQLASSSASDRDVFDKIAVEDVREATDVFRPVYDATNGADGFVSLEVSPTLARDTAGSIAEAQRLWKAVDRPNVMIKIPGTREGWPAIERCLRDGININITLLFSVEYYSAVAEAYLRALEARVEAGQPIDRLASVASVFVSRVDTEVDKRIEVKGGALMELRGTIAVASARLAYAKYLEDHAERPLACAGGEGRTTAAPALGEHRHEEPEYSDVLYVDSLIGPDTISTEPPETLKLFEDHGKVVRTLAGDTVTPARRAMDALAKGGIDYADVNRVLEAEAIEKFDTSYKKLLAVIGEKRKTLASARG